MESLNCSLLENSWWWSSWRVENRWMKVSPLSGPWWYMRARGMLRPLYMDIWSQSALVKPGGWPGTVWCREANDPKEAKGGPPAAAARKPACPLASASLVRGAIKPEDDERSLHRLQQMNTITATTTVMQMAELAAMMILSMWDWRTDSVLTSRHCPYGTVSGVMWVSSSDTTHTMMHSFRSKQSRNHSPLLRQLIHRYSLKNSSEHEILPRLERCLYHYKICYNCWTCPTTR